jgi:hypothetical protein
MEETALYEASPVQQEAHDCPAEDILYGGTAGCGKTLWLRWDPVVNQLFGEHERYLRARDAGEDFESVGWALYVREHLNQLMQTEQYMASMAKRIDPGSRYWSGDHLIEYSCGYKWQAGHLEHEDSWRAYDSNEYTHLAMDEAVTLYESQYHGLRSRVRTSDLVLRNKLRVCLASNPDSPLRGKWVKKIFVDPAPSGRALIREPVEMFDGTTEMYTRMYIPAYLSDNPNAQFRRDYEKKLRTLPRHIMLARLMCDWNVIEGAFFEHEWIPSVHVVKPFPIPSHWPVFRVLDWGYKNLCVILYVAVNEDGDLIIFKELTFNGPDCPPFKRKDSELVALAIKEYEKSTGYWDDIRDVSKLSGPADYQICEQRDGGWTIEERMAARGVCWVKSHKDRRAGTNEFLRRLRDIPPDGSGGRPGITVFETCRETVREIPLIPVSKQDPELPADENVDDHALDCLFYAGLYRAAAARKVVARPLDEWHRVSELAKARERRTRRWGYGT